MTSSLTFWVARPLSIQGIACTLCAQQITDQQGRSSANTPDASRWLGKALGWCGGLAGAAQPPFLAPASTGAGAALPRLGKSPQEGVLILFPLDKYVQFGEFTR